LPALDEHGVAELVGTVSACLQFPSDAGERQVIGKSPQQLVVARALLVGSREDGVNDAERSRWADPLCRHPVAAVDDPVAAGRMFEGANDGGADRHDAPAIGARLS
jgi:hypothetical protein